MGNQWTTFPVAQQIPNPTTQQIAKMLLQCNLKFEHPPDQIQPQTNAKQHKQDESKSGIDYALFTHYYNTFRKKKGWKVAWRRSEVKMNIWQGNEPSEHLAALDGGWAEEAESLDLLSRVSWSLLGLATCPISAFAFSLNITAKKQLNVCTSCIYLSIINLSQFDRQQLIWGRRRREKT